jgi:hypothetical protein
MDSRIELDLEIKEIQIRISRSMKPAMTRRELVDPPTLVI